LASKQNFKIIFVSESVMVLFLAA